MPSRLLATAAALIGVLWTFPTDQPGSFASPQISPVFSARSELVVLQVTVEDRSRRSVSGLSADAFTVLEDGTPQQIAFFTPQDAPVTVGLLVDSSGSMLGVWNLVAAAAGAFVATSNPDDEVFALTFNDRVRQVLDRGEPFTSDASTLRTSLLDAFSARGRTALYDAIVQGLHYLTRGTRDRKLLIVISDGGDNASIATFEQVLRQVQTSNTVVYAIVVRDPRTSHGNARHLETLATASGGEAFEPSDAAGVKAVLQHVADDVRRMYTIGYSPSQDRGPGLRRIRVRVHAPGLATPRVRTRLGYMVEDDDRSRINPFGDVMARNFRDLSEAEVLALAISLEEEDGRIYGDFADGLRDAYPASAAVFDEMQQEESQHRASLIETYRARFGDHIPLLRRQDVKGFVRRRPVWLVRPLGLGVVRRQAELMELETRRFYERSIEQVGDASVRKLLGDLAATERRHHAIAAALEQQHLTADARRSEGETERRLFVLQIVQPGLAGLMDGSVSTLAPLFAAAFATESSHDAFVVGLAASVGAGISMGFAEALSDDGSLTGRGRPTLRGIVCGLMTCAGGVGHTLPFLVSNFHLAMVIATIVVAMELAAISYIRHHYMDTPLVSATLQVVVGGILVFLAGLLIGSS